MQPNSDQLIVDHTNNCIVSDLNSLCSLHCRNEATTWTAWPTVHLQLSYYYHKNITLFNKTFLYYRVPLKTYAVLAALTLGTMSLSNLALSYLNYPTQLIFKSCKLIPVMIGSIIILGKRYGFLDYIAAVVMCVGLTMFTLGK